MNLANVSIGKIAKVKTIDAASASAKRLMEMGIVPGVSVRVIKSAPFGCPIEVRVRGYHLAMRKSDAEAIEVITEQV